MTSPPPMGAAVDRSDSLIEWSDPRLPVLIAPLALIVAILAELSLAHAGVPADGIASDAATGSAFALSGLVAWRLRPTSDAGRIMTALGFAWFFGDFLFAPVPLVGPLSLLPQAAGRVLFAWLLLSFPTGRLGSTLHRWAVGMIAGLAATLAGLQLVTIDPADLCACPSSPFAIAAGSNLATHLEAVSATVGIGMTVILVPLVVRRAVIASGPARRTLIPVLAGGAFALLSVAPDLVTRLTGLSVEPIGWLPIVYAALPIGFLIALLRSRMARGAVADLIVRLGQLPTPEHLRPALSSALGDPSLEVLRWDPLSGSYHDHEGQVVDPSSVGPTRAVALLETDRGRVAAIVHDASLLDEPGLVASVTAAMRLAVENEQLQAEVRAQLEDVRASRLRIVEAADTERRRVERNLHDGAQQRLVALSLALRRAQAQVPPDADGELKATLGSASDQLASALAELRDLARGIHPAILTEAGLGPALRALARESPIPVDLTLELEEVLPDAVAVAAYFVVAEGLANVAKYSAAEHASLRATSDGRHLRVEITDNGTGGADPEIGSGLRGLADRLAALGGRLELQSPRGEGTRLVAEVPIDPGGAR